MKNVPYYRNKKRIDNATMLKVKFLGATNTKESRLKLTQTFNGKSVTLSFNHFYADTIQQVSVLLDSIKDITRYCLLVDNTQNDFYSFAVFTNKSSFVDIVKEIKTNLNK